MVVTGDVLTGEEVRAEVEPRLRPLHVEVEAERDAVVLVVDLQHVADLNAWKHQGTVHEFFILFRIKI